MNLNKLTTCIHLNHSVNVHHVINLFTYYIIDNSVVNAGQGWNGVKMINRTILVGNLTRDPQYFKTQSGISYVRFTLAVNKKYGDKEETSFISCIAWRGSADYLNQYAKKGNTLAVEGHISTGSYDDKTTGKKVYTTDVVADSVMLMNGARSSQESQQQPKKENKPKDTSNNVYGNDSLKFDNDDVDFNNGPLIDISSDDLPF